MLVMAPLAVPVPMKDYGVFAATRIAADAEGLADSEGASPKPRVCAAALDRLRWHGVQDRRKSPTTRSSAVERFSIADITKAPQAVPGTPGSAAEGRASTRRS